VVHVLLKSLIMSLRQVIHSIPILLLLSSTTTAQPHHEVGPSLQERARQLEPLIVESASRYGIDPRILRQICFIESRFRINAVSPKGARGPMQFMPETAARYGLINPHDPKAAIDAGARFLRDLLVRFDWRIDLALAAYNAGEGAVESFRTGKPLVTSTGKVINARRLVTGGIPPYAETQSYVKSILISLDNTQDSLKRTIDHSSSNLGRRITGDATADASIKKDRALNSFIEVP
jgi:soluble lytic murein transglycosylase-like protein